jgi:signal transduction histidine kinase/CheY-like chemotaxis protein
MATPLQALLVEDCEDDALLVLQALRRGGYAVTHTRVDTAAGMRTALAERPWDVVIADYALPHFSGPEALSCLQASGLDVPFILVSGTIGEDAAVAAMKAGADDCIMKDSLARLVPAIERELRDAEVRRERRRSAQRTAALLEVAKDISGTFDLGAILERVQRRTAEVLPCDAVVTFYWDAGRAVFRLISQHGVPADLVQDAAALEFPRGQPFDAQLGGGRTFVLNDMRAQPWLPPAIYEHFGISALIAAPLRPHGRPMGALVAFTRSPDRPFDPGQVELCEGIARQLALATEAAELYRAQQEEAHVSGALARVGRALISALDSRALLDRLCQVASEVLECDASHTILRRLDEEVYVPIAAHGTTIEEREGARVVKIPRRLMSSLIGHLEQDDVAEVATIPPDILGTPRQQELFDGPHLCMALRRGQEIIGVQIAHRTGATTRFSAAHLRIAHGIAQLASLALEHARLAEEVARASRLKSDFVATMSHELRTPLNVIIGYNELVLEGAFGELKLEQKEPLRRIGRSAVELLELINMTLDVSRLEAGRLPVELKEFGLAELLAQVQAETQELQAKSGLLFQWQLPPQLPRLHTDQLKLKVVLKNLIANAVKFTEQGSVTVEAQPRNGGVEISVADTGIGIPPESRSVIFEPFRQADSSTTRRYGGVGLGLYIARRLLELLGGKIGLDSETGCGSTFRVWIPTNGHKRGTRPKRHAPELAKRQYS